MGCGRARQKDPAKQAGSGSAGKEPAVLSMQCSWEGSKPLAPCNTDPAQPPAAAESTYQHVRHRLISRDVPFWTVTNDPISLCLGSARSEAEGGREQRHQGGFT